MEGAWPRAYVRVTRCVVRRARREEKKRREIDTPTLEIETGDFVLDVSRLEGEDKRRPMASQGAADQAWRLGSSSGLSSFRQPQVRYRDAAHSRVWCSHLRETLGRGIKLKVREGRVVPPVALAPARRTCAALAAPLLRRLRTRSPCPTKAQLAGVHHLLRPP
mmetsp:Transcript_87445/g.220058  ORF Transcript_87445/g.220058 Transcript_87445/m.220058 type:complete len:163 (-) Transcript_87445:210-698(-)